MRAYNGHRRGVREHDAVVGGAVPPLVLAAPRLRRAAPLRHAGLASAVVGRYDFQLNLYTIHLSI